MEEGIRYIFNSLHKAQMKVSVIQNTAISFSVCVDTKFDTLPMLLDLLEERFKVSVTENVTLFTIRHATEAAVNKVIDQKEVLLQQVAANTVQVVVK